MVEQLEFALNCNVRGQMSTRDGREEGGYQFKACLRA